MISALRDDALQLAQRGILASSLPHSAVDNYGHLYRLGNVAKL